MDLLWKAVLQSFVQGIAEFLPVSSTAHLLLTGSMLDMGHEHFVRIFNIVIQLASILAAAIYFRKLLLPFGLCKDGTIRRKTFGLWGKILIGVIPILFAGAAAAKLGVVEALHGQPLLIAGTLFIGGVLLLRIETWVRHENTVSDFTGLSFRTAFLIGLIQCLAIIPGMSRSASTIIGALALGASRPLAAEYSFLLAIPTIMAASAYSLLKYHGALTGEEWAALGTGFAVTFLVSLCAVSWLMKFIKTHTFELFGWYRIALAAAVAGYILLNG